MNLVDKLKKAYEIQKIVNSHVDATDMTQAKLLDAFVVEIFEFWNTLETFKWWKTNKDKPRELALEELADALAFALVINITYFQEDYTCLHIVNNKGLMDNLTKEVHLDYIKNKGIYGLVKDLKDGEFAMEVVLILAGVYFSVDELLDAHAKKSLINIERQKNGY